MKTAEQKAITLMEEMESFSDIVIKAGDFENIKIGLVRLIKEQDRDTRHACAEAVAQCDVVHSINDICSDQAHDACMNVKAC